MYYIYALSDPRTPENYRYIGITYDLEKRMHQHLAFYSRQKHSHKNHWINSLINQEISPIMIKLGEYKSKKEVFDAEISTIKILKEKGFNLTNVLPGGQGGAGFGNTRAKGNKNKPKTKDHGMKIGLAQLGNTRGKANKGKKHSEEFKAKLRVPKKRCTCPYCGKEGAVGLMKRYHFDNCKLKIA
jgi:predicted GIY-YIG superfamily endonuclease